MATLPKFKQRQLARRSTSDIDRLAKQYKSNVEAITGEYQTAFTGYQAGVTEKMKPFEEQMKTYRESLLPTYESQKNLYKQKLDSYNEVLADLERNPVVAKEGIKRIDNPFWNPMNTTGYTGPMYWEEPYTYYEERPIPKFTDKAPTLPTAPVAPEVEKFDEGEFGKKRAAAESTFKREVGERKAAKLGAVSRKMVRPMLKGAE
jgi:hypothetical protein